MNISPGTLLQNRYMINRLLGKGGMGAVYQAKDQQTDETVALKQALVSDPSFQKAFEREARILTRMRHAVLPVVSDFFSTNDGLFLVMELIPGEDLETLILKKKGMFQNSKAVPWVMHWADKLLDALSYLHNQNPPIIHRDIKPQNLRIRPDGTIALLDFGIAKSVGDQTRHSIVHSVRGYTTSYAPLEQIQGTGTNPTSDLYALAATLYHILTGKAPPDALTRVSDILEGKPDPLRSANEVNPYVTPVVALILHQALSIKMADRFVSASAMRKAINLVTQASISTSSSMNPQARARSQPHTQEARLSTTTSSKQAKGVIAQRTSQPSLSRPPSPMNNNGNHKVGDGWSPINSSGEQTIVFSGFDDRNSALHSGEIDSNQKSALNNEQSLMGGMQTTSSQTSPLTSSLVVSPDGTDSTKQSMACYRSISKAIAEAPAGTRIFIRPGRYHESLVINKHIEIIGDGPEEEIVIESVSEPCVRMQTDYAIIRGITLCKKAEAQINGVPAVAIPQGRLVLEHCTIRSATRIGIAVSQKGANPVIYHCTLQESKGIGIIFTNGSHGIVDECDIFGHEYAGVNIQQNSNPIIRQCRIHSCHTHGVSIADKGAGIIEECDIYGNEQTGVHICQWCNPFVHWCKIQHQRSGVGVSVCEHGEGILESCDISGNNKAGILIARQGNPFVHRCSIHHEQQREIIIADGGRGIFERCDISYQGKTGISLGQGSNPVIRRCYIYHELLGTCDLWDNRSSHNHRQMKYSPSRASSSANSTRPIAETSFHETEEVAQMAL